MSALRLGTRKSPLALAQSQTVADRLSASFDRDVELVHITSEGDRNPADLVQIGGTGVFVAALREALLRDEIDLAVHSAKDLPTAAAPGLDIAAYPAREDPRDCLVSASGATLGELLPGARIGTGSPRRAAQLRALGFGLEIVAIRGNVDTRIAKAVGGAVDAVVLARAGLARLGRLEMITEVLDPLTMLPAPGQGALAVETRSDDALIKEVATILDDEVTRACVEAERSLLGALEAGCLAPVGALADVGEGEDGAVEVYLRAVVAAVDGSDELRRSATGPASDPVGLGRRLAEEMLSDGAAELMGER